MYIKKTHIHYALITCQSLFKVLGTQLPIKQTLTLMELKSGGDIDIKFKKIIKA